MPDREEGSAALVGNSDSPATSSASHGTSERIVDGVPALAARGLTKRFPHVTANDAVDFEVAPGEVHGLLGENGSGKTTLCKLLTGLHQPDDGYVVVGGRKVVFRSPADAYAAGVVMVHQHFSLVDRMTVAENVVLGWSRQGGFGFNRNRVEADVAAAADEFHIAVNPRAPVWQLSVGERQRVEILKALYRGARTLILDEPTTVLTPQEATHLFELVRRMAASGGSVVFISHKLHEVLAVCDRVTVLRNGKRSGVVDLAEHQDKPIDAKALAEMMVGREIDLARRSRRDRPPAATPLLSVRDVVVHNDSNRPVVKDVSLDVWPGEILGIAGVAGNGQRELADAICGLRPYEAGEVSLDGAALPPGSARAAIDRGLAYVPEDRTDVGLARGLRIADNVLLKAFRTSQYSVGPLVRRRRADARATELLERFSVRATANTLVWQLSGGNAQRVLLARELSSSPRALIIAAPTRGLDIAAIEVVRELLIEAAESGVAVMMISEDLDELLDLADRVAVMCDGRVTGIVAAENADVNEIGLLMMGHTEAMPT